MKHLDSNRTKICVSILPNDLETIEQAHVEHMPRSSRSQFIVTAVLEWAEQQRKNKKEW